MMIRAKKGEFIKKNSHFVYKIDYFTPDLLQKLLKTNHNSPEIYILEQYSKENYVIVPCLERLDYEQVEKEWSFLEGDMGNLPAYELVLKNAPMFPLYIKESINLLNEIEELPIFTQVLLKKKVGDYRQKIIPQYEDYLAGNDYPSESMLLRKFQNKVLGLLNKFGEISIPKDPVADIEDKICSHNYQFEMRFILLDSCESEFEQRINQLLKKLNYHNELQLFKVRDNSRLMQYIKHRELQSYLNSQWLSESEIMCLLSSQETKPVIIQKPQQSNVSILDFLPSNSERSHQVDDKLVSQLVDSFKRIKITNKNINVRTVKRGATLQKVSLNIPSDVVYTKIEKNLKNIQATLGNDAVSMEIGNEADTVDFYVPVENRDIVYLKSALSCEPFQAHLRDGYIPLILGEDSVGTPLYDCLTRLKHILIAGATGSGKSVYLNTIILTMLMYKSPEEVQMILIDPKQVELDQFKEFPHVTFVKDMDKAKGAFTTLIQKMEERYELFSNHKCKNLQQYNQKAKSKLPYIVCIVDELSDLMDTHGQEIEEDIIRLGQKARAAGIHMILCTQKPSADVITTRIKSNLPSAISFRLKAQSDYRTVFGKGIPYNLLGNGDGVAMIEGSSKEFVRFQSPIITLDENEEQVIIEKVLGQYGDSSGNEFEIMEEELPLDKLKRVISETGETRIGELQKILSIRTKDVSDLVKELVEEGWLIKEGKSYQLIAEESELDKWRGTAE